VSQAERFILAFAVVHWTTPGELAGFCAGMIVQITEDGQVGFEHSCFLAEVFGVGGEEISDCCGVLRGEPRGCRRPRWSTVD